MRDDTHKPHKLLEGYPQKRGFTDLTQEEKDYLIAYSPSVNEASRKFYTKLNEILKNETDSSEQ